MEEKSKEVRMNPAKTSQEKKEIPYDELKKLAQNVFDENRYLKEKLYEAQQHIALFNRLDYLLRIVEVANSTKSWKFDDDFIQMCINDIETAMTPPEEKEEEEIKPEEN